MVAERVNSSQKLLDMGEKGVYFSYPLVKQFCRWLTRTQRLS